MAKKVTKKTIARSEGPSPDPSMLEQSENGQAAESELRVMSTDGETLRAFRTGDEDRKACPRCTDPDANVLVPMYPRANGDMIKFLCPCCGNQFNQPRKEFLAAHRMNQLMEEDGDHTDLLQGREVKLERPT